MLSRLRKDPSRNGRGHGTLLGPPALELERSRARVGGYRLALVDALRVQAMIAIRQERWAEAEAALEEGLSLAQDMPYPYVEARLLHVYGEMHLQKGESGLARERLEAALTIFWRLGARKDAERAQEAMWRACSP